MATDVVEEETADALDIDGLDVETEDAPSGGRFALGGKKAKVLALLVIVMVVQGAAMYLLFPKPAQINDEKDGSAAAGDDGQNDGVATSEVLIDRFNTTNSRAEPGSVLNVSFELVAEVSKDNELIFGEAANKAQGPCAAGHCRGHPQFQFAGSR
jgi:hypothetical protein